MQRPYIIEDWGPESAWYKWSRNYLQRHLWRITHVIGNDINDALQEAALTYLETRQRYGATVNSPAHFMRLFQMSLSCWVTDLSHKDTHIKIGLAAVSKEEPSVNMDEMNVLLDKGSSDLKEVLNILFNAPQEVMGVLREEASSPSPRQFWNRCLEFAGINKDKSKILMKELTDLLS